MPTFDTTAYIERVNARTLRIRIDKFCDSEFDIIEDYLKKKYVISKEDEKRALAILEENYATQHIAR